MIILKGKNLTIKLNKNGSYTINEKHYFPKEKDKNLYKKFSLFLKDRKLNNEIIYEDLPLFYQNKIYKDLCSIKNKNYLDKNERQLLENKLVRFGFDFDNRITKLEEEKYLNLLYKAGYSKLEFDKNRDKKVNEMVLSDADKIKNNEILQTFLTNFKNGKLNNFSLFSETVQELTGCDDKEAFRLYNDKIDENFVLDSEEYKFIYQAKKRLIEKQQKVIENAIKYGIEVPIELPRFIAPSNKFKDIILNPEKAKMIARFDFDEYDKKDSYKSKLVDNGVIKDEKSKILSQRIKNGLKKINLDINNSTEFITAQIIKNGGFDYNKFKEWAVCTSHNGINNVDDAFATINNGLLHCNRLVEAGILKCTGDGTYKFRSERCRDILFNNPDDNYVELSNKVIETYNISYESIQKMKDDAKNLIEIQKIDFFSYLDAQFDSFYKVQDKTIDDFIKDVLHVKSPVSDKNIDELYNSEEYNYCKSFYPELFHSIDKFKNIIVEYKDEKTYKYVRDTKYDFSKNINSVKDKYKTLKSKNSEIKDINNPVKTEFKDIASLNFNGVDLKKLDNFKEYGIKNGKNKKDLDLFIKKSIERANELVKAGILQKDNFGNYQFVDDYAKKVLFENLGASVETLKLANRGIKTKINLDNIPDEKQDKKIEQKKENRLSDSDLIKRFEKFNFNYKYSKNNKFKMILQNKENELKAELLAAYSSGDKAIVKYFDEHNFNEKDAKYRKKIVKEIKKTDIDEEMNKINSVNSEKVNLKV